MTVVISLTLVLTRGSLKMTIRYLSRIVASRYLFERHGLRRSPKYLAKLASNGCGPAFHKANRDALYAPSDLDAWAIRIIGDGAFSAAEHRLAETIAA
jgi:hypothetical protein